MPIDDKKLEALLATGDYPTLDDQPAADKMNAPTVPDGTWLPLDLLENWMLNSSVILAVRDKAAAGGAAAVPSRIVLELLGSRLSEINLDKPQAQSVLNGLVGTSVLDIPQRDEVLAQGTPRYKSVAQDAGIVAPGEQVSHLDVARVRNAAGRG